MANVQASTAGGAHPASPSAVTAVPRLHNTSYVFPTPSEALSAHAVASAPAEITTSRPPLFPTRLLHGGSSARLTDALAVNGADNKDESASRAAHLNRSNRICHYFSKKGKCRDGENCRFRHEKPQATINPESTQPSETGTGADEDGMVPDRRQAVQKPVPASRVVQKPISQAQAQDPREFQLGQIRRRFSPKETSQNASELWGTEKGTLLQFKLPPSDPDFPFEMDALECSLLVPLRFPESRATLRVGNKDIPRGYAVNVENGFNNLANEKKDATLLELMKALDKNLEVFLSEQKAETIKIVVNKDTRHLSNLPVRAVEPITSAKVPEPVPSSQVAPKTPAVPQPTFTKTQKAEAAKRRETETMQLQARMGRLPLFKKSGDGIAYTIPIEPRKRSELPVTLQAVKTIQLFVPLLYPLQSCRVQLEGVDTQDAKAVEKGFEQKAAVQTEVTLMGHVNYLAQNIHILAKTVLEEKKPVQTIAPEPVSTSKAEDTSSSSHQDPDRSHIQYISRPPEWTIIDDPDVSDSEDGYSYDSGDETSSEEEESKGAELKLKSDQASATAPASNVERGTAISFPFLELYGIELLEIVTLNITVKCERCKEVMEVRGLKDGVEKSESCKKCASPLSIKFRKDLVHSHAVRAGFLDLDGCNIGDMLLSSFLPTCSQCSTTFPLPGIVSVQGETTSDICHECHQKFTFKLPSVKFLRISSTHQLAATSGPRRKKETLGLTPGTPLPKKGTCRHYAKSYRWFRFSCCQKVYACDKCHDSTEDHPPEWANRMLCGWCSREGNYRTEDCGFCHSRLVGKRGGGGFWEGGKGTRDRVKMSRKDKRKFRRVGGAK
ncbi:hypothetical protein BP5796_03840 [Coleophoma crateriformis]|uniref:CHY-type domain-containing protein n=1 Tax=Coleophoma crateriformis TaxID=565419 RepID=A0A3D8SGP1_9HELO|nr:hypothetical protein BP5796_03840 [Coleophoma crateriformis]